MNEPKKTFKNGPSSDGFININQKRNSEKSPEWQGYIPITKEMLQTWIERVKEGKTVEAKVVLWDRVKAADQRPYKYARIEASVWDKDEKKEEGPAAQPSNAVATPEFSDDDIPF